MSLSVDVSCLVICRSFVVFIYVAYVAYVVCVVICYYIMVSNPPPLKKKYLKEVGVVRLGVSSCVVVGGFVSFVSLYVICVTLFLCVVICHCYYMFANKTPPTNTLHKTKEPLKEIP